MVTSVLQQMENLGLSNYVLSQVQGLLVRPYPIRKYRKGILNYIRNMGPYSMTRPGLRVHFEKIDVDGNLFDTGKQLYWEAFSNTWHADTIYTRPTVAGQGKELRISKATGAMLTLASASTSAKAIALSAGLSRQVEESFSDIDLLRFKMGSFEHDNEFQICTGPINNHILDALYRVAFKVEVEPFKISGVSTSIIDLDLDNEPPTIPDEIRWHSFVHKQMRQYRDDFFALIRG